MIQIFKAPEGHTCRFQLRVQQEPFTDPEGAFYQITGTFNLRFQGFMVHVGDPVTDVHVQQPLFPTVGPFSTRQITRLFRQWVATEHRETLLEMRRHL